MSSSGGGWWWLDNDKGRGPVSHHEIIQLWKDQRISEETYFWKEGSSANSKWVRLRRIPDLSDLIHSISAGNTEMTNVYKEKQRPMMPSAPNSSTNPDPYTVDIKAPRQEKKKKQAVTTEIDHSALAQFLEKGADLQLIWENFDKDGSGSIDAEEFENLIYTCLALFMVSQSDENVDVPTQDELEPVVSNLVETLLPKLDKDGDGEIDRQEFEKLGEYITEQFVMLKSGDRKDLTGSGGVSGLASVAQQMFAEAKEVRMHDYEKKKGHIDFFGGQILNYKAYRLVNFGVFDTVRGTVLMSFELWIKLGFLSLVFLTGAVVCKYALGATRADASADIIDFEDLKGFLAPLEALLAFFAGLYLQQILDRWWTIRADGIGGVCNSVADLSLAIAGLVHGTSKNEKNLRKIITRYGLLAHALIYLQAQERMDGEGDPEAWGDLVERNLVMNKEVKILKKLKRKSEAVWGWIISYLEHCMHSQAGDPNEDPLIPDDRLEQLTDICREGRNASSLVSLHLECQLPLPYVHLIALVVNLYQVVLALVSGMVCVAAYETTDPSKYGMQVLIIQIIQFVLYCIIYQGILETADKMTNPLGLDDIDFPQFYIHHTLQSEIKAIYNTSLNLPWQKSKKA